MNLKWNNRDGYILTQIAKHGDYEFIVFRALNEGGYRAQIEKEGIIVDQYHGGLDENYSKDNCIKYCETFFRKNLNTYKKTARDGK